MRISFGKIGVLCVFALTLSFLTLAGVPAQAQMMGRPPVGMRPPAPDTSWQQNDNWRRYQQRFFGGVSMQPRRGESMSSFRTRVVQQCNSQWDRCVRRCNVGGPRYQAQRNVCVANCNNFLFECRAGW